MNSFEFERFINNRNQMTYTVMPGDSLYKIASLHNITVESLMKYNKLTSTTIYPNQILFIPNNSNTNSRYVTVNGDTLMDVANKLGINYKDLEKHVDIYNLKLVDGQYINISKYHEIKPQENITDILEEYNMTPLELIELNSKNWLKPGEKIIVK